MSETCDHTYSVDGDGQGTCMLCGQDQFAQECETHTWVLQLNIANTPVRNYCEECGATEEADPNDIEEQHRLLAEMDKLENKIEMVWTRADFERIVGRTLTDKEWEVMASEVESETEEFWFVKIVKSKFEIIEHLVEQDSKYD